LEFSQAQVYKLQNAIHLAMNNEICACLITCSRLPHSFKPVMHWSITSPGSQKAYKEKPQDPHPTRRFYEETEIGNRNNENSSEELTR